MTDWVILFLHFCNCIDISKPPSSYMNTVTATMAIITAKAPMSSLLAKTGAPTCLRLHAKKRKPGAKQTAEIITLEIPVAKSI